MILNDIEMELLTDGVDEGVEPDLDNGEDSLEEGSDDEAWMCDEEEGEVDPSLRERNLVDCFGEVVVEDMEDAFMHSFHLSLRRSHL